MRHPTSSYTRRGRENDSLDTSDNILCTLFMRSSTWHETAQLRPRHEVVSPVQQAVSAEKLTQPSTSRPCASMLLHSTAENAWKKLDRWKTRMCRIGRLLDPRLEDEITFIPIRYRILAYAYSTILGWEPLMRQRTVCSVLDKATY